MIQAYRSSYEHIVGSRLAELTHAGAVIDLARPKLEAIVAKRVARTLAGVVGIVGAFATVLIAFLESDYPNEEWGTYVLLASSSAAIVTYLAVRLLLRSGDHLLRRSRPLPTLATLSGRLDADLATLDALDPVRQWLSRLAGTRGKHEAFVRAVPLIAISLLTPLTLHWLFSFLLTAQGARDFAVWIKISAVVVGHAHLALAYLSYRFTTKLARSSTAEIEAMSIHGEWGKTLGITVLVSAVPGILALAVPPILSAITGLVFIPVMFILTRNQVLEERAMLSMVESAAA
jgi:hypothetical protein